MNSLNILVLSSHICLFFIFVNGEFNLEELAKKSIEPFCENGPNRTNLMKCNSLNYPDYGAYFRKCGKSLLLEKAVDFGCKNPLAAAECLTEIIPHKTNFEIERLSRYHACIHVKLTKEQIKEYYKELEKLQ